MGCGYKNLQLDYELWMVLKDHLRYFVIISQLCYIPTTTGAQRSRSIFLVVKERVQNGQKEFRMVRCL